MTYTPPRKMLENYANVLVNFALGSGKGIKKGDTVLVTAFDSAKPLFAEVRKAILKAGGNIIPDYRPDNEKDMNFDMDFYLNAGKNQLSFFPEKYYKGLVGSIDHSIFLISENDKESLKGMDPAKIMARQVAFKPYADMRNQKEGVGKFSWTLGLYGTPAMAKEVGLSEKQYWQQIIDACFLNEKDPIAKWRSVYKNMEGYRRKLNALKAEKFHIHGVDADLWITLGEKRKWIGGSGRNIPSFEIFTSPDWRGTNGWIRFNQPLYRFGNIVEGIELEFKDGVVVKCKAAKNEKIIKEMIAATNANKIGEFSMTDRRFSRITKFMGETLYDENVGGSDGNTHIALGNSYHNCFYGDSGKMKQKDWGMLGYNNSPIHTDIVSTAPRTVTAVLKNGKEKIIYKDGQFVL